MAFNSSSSIQNEGLYGFCSGYDVAHVFGFNGMEKDDEVKGNGNSIFYKERIQDPRIGRFLSVDPIGTEFPWNSPYAFAENDVIRSIDLDGLEKMYYTSKAKNLWNSFQKVVTHDDVLKKSLISDITKPELREKVVIYFTTHSEESNGRTYPNLQAAARRIQLYDAAPEGSALRDDEYETSNVAYYRSMIKDLGVSYNKLLEYHEKGIKVHAIAANPKQSLIDQIISQAHEIDLHLKNDIAGINLLPEQEHVNGFGKEYYDKTGTSKRYSPPHNETPPGSRMGKLIQRINAAAKKADVQ